MSITSFVPEIWTAQLLSSLKKALVFAGPGTVNRDYEGEIAQAGDTVRITSISRPTVADYTKGSTTITPESLVDAQRSLVINACKYFAFEIDDVDMRQSKSGGALMAEAASEAAYALALAADQYVAALWLTDIDAGNVLNAGGLSITTADLAVKAIISMKTQMDSCNIPMQGRYVIVPPWFHALLLQDYRFVTQYASGTTEALRNGVLGTAFGFDVMMSNNCDNIEGDNWLLYAGSPIAITYAEQINKVEAYRPQDSFSDALKGLHLYGGKVVRPTAIVTLEASIT